MKMSDKKWIGLEIMLLWLSLTAGILALVIIAFMVRIIANGNAQ